MKLLSYSMPASVARISMVVAAILAIAAPAVAGSPMPLESAAGSSGGTALYVLSRGSYYAGKNIVVNGGKKNAINITGPNVTIDFRGYSITGKNGAAGIGINGPGKAQITIRNLNLAGMGGGGILIGANSTVETTHVTGCGYGIETGVSSLIDDNSVTSSITGDGIDGSGVIRGNVSDNNAGNGITAGANSVVINNEVSGNTGVGIAMQSSTGYSTNVINSTGTPVSGGYAMGGNACNGAPCP
ncbi:MAG: hypothetical protein IVW54_21860 [Candidatus Binataceae bacterium]|nr:hypothetical protein [Candidatus Binataceae bacterium]